MQKGDKMLVVERMLKCANLKGQCPEFDFCPN